MQPRQYVAPQTTSIATKQTQPSICGSSRIQYINLGKAMRAARIRQQAAYAVIGLAAKYERSPIQPLALVANGGHGQSHVVLAYVLLDVGTVDKFRQIGGRSRKVW